MNVKKIIKQITPPILLDLLSRIKPKGNYWIGNYESWEEAQVYCEGYDSEEILKKVQESLLKVKNGEAVYERDSVIFNREEYSWPLLAGLLWIASQSGNKLNVIDFGGSLGSTYFQNRRFLTQLTELHWNIVEQEKFVKCGRTSFQDEYLRFYYTIDECLKEQDPNTILLSSVLPYLEKPYELLEKIVTTKFRYLIIDRTPFLEKGNDRITVQKVDPKIYEASYPAWFFNQDKFMRFFSETYDLIADFESQDRANIRSYFKGFILKLKENA